MIHLSDMIYRYSSDSLVGLGCFSDSLIWLGMFFWFTCWTGICFWFTYLIGDWGWYTCLTEDVRIVYLCLIGDALLIHLTDWVCSSEFWSTCVTCLIRNVLLIHLKSYNVYGRMSRESIQNLSLSAVFCIQSRSDWSFAGFSAEDWGYSGWGDGCQEAAQRGRLSDLPAPLLHGVGGGGAEDRLAAGLHTKTRTSRSAAGVSAPILGLGPACLGFIANTWPGSGMLGF